MRTEAAGAVKCLVAGLVLVLLVVGMGRESEGAVGDVIESFNIPVSAVCSEGGFTGSALAMVQGSKVGFPDIPVLLVTSCVTFNDISASNLYFIDPGYSDGGPEVVKTVTTSLNRTWAALTLRADTGDLLACTNTEGGTELYSIDISIFNTITDGTTNLVRSGPTGSSCRGIAWDVSDKTIFQTSNTGNILHFPPSATGASLPSIASGCPAGTAVAGVAVAGPSLFVGCEPQGPIINFNPPPSKVAAAPRPRAAVRKGEDDFVPSEFKDFLRSMDVELAQGTGPTTTIRQLNKANGNLLRTLGGALANLDLAGFACDAATFGQSSRDALWVKDGSFSDVNAVEIPGGTCSLSGTVPLLTSPGACPVHPVTGATYPKNPDLSPLDTDGDGLPDCWEDGAVWAVGSPYVANPPDLTGQGLPGIDFDGDGTRDIVLCVEGNGQTGFQAADCANKNKKNIFVEFDSMTQHAPITAQLNQVVAAFLNAPVGNPGGNADGINLHVQIGDQNVLHSLNTAMPPCTPPAPPNTPPAGNGTNANFDDLKKLWFGTSAERGLANPQREKTLSAKKLAFRYGLAVHNLTRTPTTAPSPSGCAEVPGNDFVIALGSFGSGAHRNGVGTQEYWAGTYMHELGHNLGLRHGGGDNANCKPNYLSIMSYPRQFKTVITDRPLDYSRQELPALNEAGLNEQAGIVGSPPVTIEQAPGAPTARTVHGLGTAKLPSAAGAINWNTPTNSTPNDQNLAIDINQIGTVSGCDGTNGVGTTLFGYDDWANLVYNFRATIDFADGSYQSMDEVKEVTEPQVQDLKESVDADGDGVKDVNSCGGAACAIDIVPGLANNKVLLFKHNGVPRSIIPVALLSSPVFNATLVDPHTLTFANTPVSELNGRPVCANLDVNRDKRRDLVCTFVVTGLEPGEQTAILDGMSFDTAIRAEGIMIVVRVPQDDDD
jgi:hypothetical protein